MMKININLDKTTDEVLFLKKEIKNYKLSAFKKLIKNNIKFDDEE